MNRIERVPELIRKFSPFELQKISRIKNQSPFIYLSRLTVTNWRDFEHPIVALHPVFLDKNTKIKVGLLTFYRVNSNITHLIYKNYPKLKCRHLFVMSAKIGYSKSGMFVDQIEMEHTNANQFNFVLEDDNRFYG